MRSYHLFCIAGFSLLTGCAEFLHGLANSGIQPEPPRNYTTNPITLPAAPPPTQPNFGNTNKEEYKTILVNTPNGVVYRRCKFLNDQVVACF